MKQIIHFFLEGESPTLKLKKWTEETRSKRRLKVN